MIVIKKIISMLLSVVILLSITLGLDLTANADCKTCGDYKYYISYTDGTACIEGYTGTDANVIIPSMLDGIEVTTIESQAFLNNHNIVNVTVPDSVNRICVLAFENCTNLKNIILPNNLTTIEWKVFLNCRSLKSITVPKNVKHIERYPFKKCLALESIKVDRDNKYFSSKDGVLYNKEKTKLVIYPPGKKATTFKIPSKVTTIDKTAFNRCKKLTNLTIPSSVKKIEPDAFYGCSGMKKITVDKANKKYSSKDGVLFDKKKKDLISYPAGKTDKSYKIPKTVVKINDYAFVSSKIVKLYIPKSVKCICYFDGEEASLFHNCKKLRDIYYNGSKKEWKKIYFYSLEYHGDLVKFYYEEYGGKNGKNLLERRINLSKNFYNKNGKEVRFHYNVKF